MLDLLFETSWEVCNKVGGIYTVLSTKARSMHKTFGDKLIFVGPDLWAPEKEAPDFIQPKHILSSWTKKAALPYGITVRVGRWDIPGRPIAVLVSFQHLMGNINDVYGQMWERFRVDSLHGYGDYDEACAFAFAAGVVIESIARHYADGGKVVAHFDEWTTGMGLLHLKSHVPWIHTVFTTHATSVGRSIAGNGKPLYDYMQGYNGDQMARELNIESKHSLEKAAAHAADVFTTVSEVTARECEQLLERRPMVTPNAFEQNFVPRGKALENVRKNSRSRMLQVAKALTGHALPDDTMLVATSGRCEFRNKGIDLYLDALNVTRTRLNSLSGCRPIVAFVMVPSWVDSPRADLVRTIACGDNGSLNFPFVTHNLHEPEHDAILCKMRDLRFGNEPSDHLLVIHVPCYLNGHDGIFGMSYYDLLAGLDLTMFPSYYEPWGYTPLESIAFAVPTITTNLSGFGQWVLDTFGNNANETGVTVLNRTDSNYDETVQQLSDEIIRYYQMDYVDWYRYHRRTQATSRHAQWEQFMKYYLDAYNVSIPDETTK